MSKLRALNVTLSGAAEWVNRVELVLRGSASFAIDFLELGAYWFEPEAMKDGCETSGEWAEDCPGTGNDLSSPNDTSQGFSDYLRDRGWVWLHDRGKRVTEPGRIYMTADVPSLQGSILEPLDGKSFPVHTMIDFVGQASGGTPPYTYEWSSNVLGALSNQPSFSTDQLVPNLKGGEIQPTTIELEVTDNSGYTATAMISLTLTGPTPVEDELPSHFALAQNAPNPFNPRTVIAFSLKEAADVTLTVFDLRGREVRTILDQERLGAGPQSRLWEGTDASGRPVAAGTYVYRLVAEARGHVLFEEERKMTLLK